MNGGVDFVGAPVAHTFAQAGLGVMLVVGMYSLALAVGLFSFGLRRADNIPNWLSIAGLVIAVLLLGSYIWLPGYLLPKLVWLLSLPFQPVFLPMSDISDVVGLIQWNERRDRHAIHTPAVVVANRPLLPSDPVLITDRGLTMPLVHASLLLGDGSASGYTPWSRSDITVCAAWNASNGVRCRPTTIRGRLSRWYKSVWQQWMSCN